jgi:hypothetical protein
MLENNNIKYKTDIIGFLVTIMNIPRDIDNIASIFKKPVE